MCNDFLKLTSIVTATIFFMIANIIASSIIASKDSLFDIELFKSSLVKYFGVLIIGIFLYFGGYFGDEILNGITTDVLNSKNLVLVGIASVALKYAVESLSKWKTLTEMKIISNNAKEHDK